MTMLRKPLVLALLVLAAALANAAAETWPARPVKLIVGFAAGGPTDLFARLIAQKLSEQTGKNFYVENVGGAGGNIGAARAAQSPADGYTALVTGGNITNNPFLYSQVPYDPLKDFDAVTVGAATPVVLAVNPSVPARSVKELVALIRANPGKYSYASPGTGTPPQLVGALFAHELNLDLVHVPFGGGGPAVEATVGNHTPISFGAMAPAVPLIKSGDLRALAVTGAARSPTLPEIPTMAEAGFPEVEGSTWTAVVVPAGTPKDIIAELHRLIVAAVTAPDVKEKLAAMAYVPIGNSPEECTAFFKAEMAKWGKLIKDAGLRAE
ncbi:MAG TPA: tripartite tricarboxylate transporter substrate binding protein [Xanthobacteraceae bacterium]|nr:tripartite tricarboxylate transporter substrate binding protein [Xanthobacteraceae bacterium]